MKLSKHLLAIWLAIGLVAVAAAVAGVAIIRLYHEVQSQRHDSIIVGCRDQNKRHDDTIAFLNRLAARQIKADPKKRAAIERSLSLYFKLLHAEIPKKNCAVLARQFVPPATH